MMANDAIKTLSIIIISISSSLALQCTISTTFDCSNPQPECAGFDSIIALPTTIYNCTTTLVIEAK
jgi:hypothetical protein